MTETTAPAGYLLNQAAYMVVITAEYEAQTSKKWRYVHFLGCRDHG